MNTTPPALRDQAPAGPRRRTGRHTLDVTDVRHLTADTVAVTLHVPAELRDVFAHHPGQHVVVRHRRAVPNCAAATRSARHRTHPGRSVW